MTADATPANVGSNDGLGLAPKRDLVERLREMSRRGHWPLIGDEAADEIERLQDAITALLDLFHTGQVSIRQEAAGYAEAVIEVGEQCLRPNAELTGQTGLPGCSG